MRGLSISACVRQRRVMRRKLRSKRVEPAVRRRPKRKPHPQAMPSPKAIVGGVTGLRVSSGWEWLPVGFESARRFHYWQSDLQPGSRIQTAHGFQLRLRRLREKMNWWARSDLNREPKHYECSALTIELRAHAVITIQKIGPLHKNKSPKMKTL